jgi:hypothetical protein
VKAKAVSRTILLLGWDSMAEKYSYQVRTSWIQASQSFSSTMMRPDGLGKWSSV